jgi:putative membrane protein
MKFFATLLFIFTAVLTWSAINPHDYFTWFLEVIPAIIGLIILAATYKRFKFTKMLYVLILIHCIVLMVGGKYTYAQVPLFDWIQEIFNQARNNYDKVGHFMQGFVPAMVLRELLVRGKVVNSNKWRNFFIISVAMAISVTYEFIEWFAALMIGESAESFLGTQGYVWDTQSDMLYCTIGAIVALVLLSKVHDKYIKKLEE